ncbi:MAG: hypothetical protein ACE5JR_08290 [Gemmatimonadota bacterium]
MSLESRPAARRVALFSAFLGLVGCGGQPSPGLPLGARTAAAQDRPTWADSIETTRGEALPPAGYGTLEQDDVTVPLEAGDLLIKVVPLAESVIRMTAPDTYRRLNGYKAALTETIQELARGAGESGWPQVLFVTLFTRSVEASFQPHDLQIRTQNTTYRPLDIIPVTADFGRGRLDQQETQIALYLFSADIDLELPLTVVYQGTESSRWNAIRNRLDAELSRVLSRAGAGDSEGG